MSTVTIEGYALSGPQRRGWHERQIGCILPHPQFAVHVEGELDQEGLLAAVRSTVERNEILRTTFRALPGMRTPLQIVRDWVEPHWQYEDLSAVPRSRQAQLLQENAARESYQRLNLSEGPLLRCCLFTLAPEEHELLVTLSALCADHRTLEIFVDEISRSYAAQSHGADLREAPVAYCQFSEWQNSLQHADDAAAGRSYWHTHTASLPPVAKLPFERIAPREGNFKARRFTFEVETRVEKQVCALAERLETGVNTIYLASWHCLLSRLSSSNDIVTSYVFEGRELPTLCDVLGPVANSLPVASHIEDETPFVDVCKQLDRAVEEGAEWQDFFECSERPSTDRHGQPTRSDREIAFHFHRSVAKYEAGRVLVRVRGRFWFPHDMKLRLDCTEVEGSCRFGLYYDANAFRESDVERLSRHFTTLLRRGAEAPDTQAGKLPLLAESDRRAMLQAAVAPQVEFPDKCIHELFEQQVEMTPNTRAVVGERELTYAELNAEANRLAHGLRGLGVASGDYVALCGERSVDVLVGLLGILKAGAAYVPLSPTHPRARLRYQLDQTRTRVLLTKRAHVESLPDFQGQIVCLDADQGRWTNEPATNPIVDITPTDDAYATFTSGSTGTPKGVVITHRNLVNYAYFICRRLGLLEPPAPQRLQFATVSTITADLGNTCIYPSLISGGCLHLLSEEVATDGKKFAQYVYENPIDVLKIVPSHLGALLASRSIGAAILPRRFLICGGEALTTELAEELAKEADGCQIINHYGPTEATVGCLTAAVDMEVLRGAETSTAPIGRPIANTEAYVLDEQRELVPPGVAGELYVGGVGLARCYLNEPQLTAEQFVSHPFAPNPEARLYKTGDLVRQLPSGELVFLGRTDHQVKIRGYRIEPGEIESVLARHELVRQALVVAQDDDIGNKQLVAYVVAEGGPEPSSTELIQSLQNELPPYMVPSAFTILEEMPLTANGKIDRAALPRAERTAAGDGTDSSPRSPVEDVLSGIWCRLLGRKQVGIFENFFSIGGHSLLAMQLVARVRDAFEVELPLGDIFDAPTIEQLAERIKRAHDAQPTEELPELSAIPRDRSLPLSFAQQRLWFLDQLSPGNSTYNVPIGVRLVGDFSVGVLRRVLREIVRRHEGLRTSFRVVDGKPTQSILENVSPSVPCVDLRGLETAARENEAQRLAKEEARQSFDLARGPLLRVTLLRLGEQDHVLLFTMHHIISDFWSRTILTREFAVLSVAFQAGRESPLPELPVQYVDYAAWQRSWLQGDRLQDQLQYWRHQLSGIPPLLDVPTDRPRPAVLTPRGADKTVSFDPTLSAKLRALSQREGATLFMTLLAAFQTLLHRFAGQSDICVGTPISGRKHPETEHMIGFFLNHLIIRTRFSGDPKLRDVLRIVRKTTLEAYAHQDVPFEHLVEALQPKRALNRAPLFQVSFSTITRPSAAAELPGLSVQSFGDHDSGSAKFDMALLMIDSVGGLTAHLQYSTDLFDEETITRLLGYYREILEEFADNPHERISHIRLLTESERDRILSLNNRQEGHSAAPRCVHQQFEAQVKQTPDAVAVVSGDHQLTYAALDRLATRLANRLWAEGIRAESIVGVFMDRCPEALISLFGVLKAGGAYLPLDPDAPPNRLRYMIQDARVHVVLSLRRLAGRLPSDTPSRLCVDDLQLFDGPADPAYPLGPAAENVAYVIYTSGTTGTPKGVMIPHHAIARHCNDVTRYYRLRSDDCVLQFASLSFDASLEQIFDTLLIGAKLVLRADARDPAEVIAQVAKHGISVVNVPPAYWHQILLAAGDFPRDVGRRVGLVIVGGDVMSPESVRLWRRSSLTAARLLNAYGPTESTITATAFEVPSAASGASTPGRLPIGQPIAGKQAFVLNEYGGLSAVGIPGELALGGPNLARGYLGQAELTAERFVPHPFFSQAGQRLYRSGDVARLLPSENLEFLGRVDQQVKIRGFRIELGEVEAKLGTHEAVQNAAVIAHGDDPNDKRLVAYVVAVGDDRPSVDQLRLYLRAELPEYMVPTAFVFLKSLPLTRSGKIDRHALPAPTADRPALDEDFVAPRSPVETHIAQLVAELLRLDRVGIHDNFFSLGGHSLLATQFISRIRHALGVELPLRVLFDKPTICQLAEEIERRKSADPPAEMPAIVSIPRQARRVPRSALTSQSFDPTVEFQAPQNRQ